MNDQDAIYIRNAKEILALLDNMELKQSCVFGSNATINWQLNCILNHTIDESKKTAMEVVIRIHQAKARSVILQAIADESKFDCNLLTFGLLMLDELILLADGRNEKTFSLEEIMAESFIVQELKENHHKCNSLLFAILPYSKNMKSVINKII